MRIWLSLFEVVYLWQSELSIGKKYYEEIVDHLFDDIKNGVYKVNEELPSERELMEEFGVGRPAVREAISKLELMGLIDVRSGSVAKVREPTIQRLVDEMSGVVQLLLMSPEGEATFQEIRLILEVALVRKAARDAGSEQIRKLELALEDNRQNLNDRNKFAESDLSFHQALAEITGNSVIIGVMQSLSSWLMRKREVTLAKSGQSKMAFEAHQKILDGIKNETQI